jgi:acyl carrier protein
MRDKLINFINEEILAERGLRIDLDDELLLGGYLDSMAVFSLVSFIESELGLPVPAQDIIIENFRSVSVICDYLQPGE